ncbi:MAG: hypothetical protein KF866_07020 [Phycisphaeraceae bacterium]|nr:hypothetical protein [Phycisphaeraceae bacterium]
MPHATRHAITRLFALACFLPALLACSTTPDQGATITTPPEAYAQTFEAARETLIANRFELDRVDAAAGVITTRPKGTLGLASPWDAEHADVREQASDLINSRSRVVRVTFLDPSTANDHPAATPGSGIQPFIDLRGAQGPLEAHVEVIVYQRHTQGRRIETHSIRRSSFFRDPDLIARGMSPSYSVPITQDPRFAARLAADIRTRVARQALP